MKHTYQVNGMTCNHCRTSVEKTLNDVAGVSVATVDLGKAEATIEMNNQVSIETFQTALKELNDNFSINSKV